MNPQTPHWAQTEWGGAQVGDLRRTKRLIRLAQQRATQPHASQAWLAQGKVVLCVQDATLLDYTAHPATEGLGVLNDEHHRGLVMHTTLAVTPQRVPLGMWYTYRWVVEMYHKVLKSGCRVEERQFGSAQNLRRYLGLDSIIAWRVLFLILLGRELSAMPCSALLEAHEWQALLCIRPPLPRRSLRL